MKTGPLWTKARLIRVLRLNFGGTEHLDTTAVAEAMGVTEPTVKRWLGKGHGRSLAKIPTKRLTQLLEMIRPNQALFDNEERDGNYAEDAIHAIGLGRGQGILPAWKEERWLEPHNVVILRVHKYGQYFFQIAWTRAEHKNMQKLKRRGEVIDLIQVPTRFHAGAVQHQVLTQLDPWRFRASTKHVPQGNTKCWFDDAPPISLARIATELQQEREQAAKQRFARKPRGRQTQPTNICNEPEDDE